jgi:uncharacterized protein
MKMRGRLRFARDDCSIAADSREWLRVIRILANTVEESEGRDYEFAGRLTADLVKNCLPSLSCDFYLCGPAGFIQDMYDGLRVLGVADQRILAEAFGPAALCRLRSASFAVGFPEPSRRPVRVRFEKSRVDAVWEPGSGTLLDLAEGVGLAPDFNCRSGSCGTCRVPLASPTMPGHF